MTEAQAARTWGVSKQTVRRWLAGGLVETAHYSQVEKAWVIADGTLAPHIFKGKQHKTFAGRLALILRALNVNQSIAPARLNMDRAELQEHFLALQEAAFIRQKKTLPAKNAGSADLFQCYTLTAQGVERLEGNRMLRQIASDLAPAISALSEGAAKGVASKVFT